MQFKENRGIYLQIAETLMERLLGAAESQSQEGQEEEKFPSIRDTAEEFGVNPNTVMRSYAFLQDLDIIFNRRGLGFFVDPGARKKIMDWKKKIFIEEELPEVFRSMVLLEMSINDFSEQFKHYKTGHSQKKALKKTLTGGSL